MWMSKYAHIKYLNYKSKVINCKEDNISEKIDLWVYNVLNRSKWNITAGYLYTTW